MNPFTLAALLVTSAAAASGQQSPNILILVADDMRPDAIHARKNDRIQTPNLDRLAARGVTFTQATCSYPICVVSRAEMMTGRHAWENGVDGLGGTKLREGQVFWAEAFRKAGYATCYTGKWHTHGRPSQRGYAEVAGLFSGGGGQWWKPGQSDWKGFPITGYNGWIFQSDDGKQKFPELGVGLTPGIDGKFADAAIEFIQRQSAQPWFLHVNFTGPHDPLFMPPGMEGKYQAANMALPANFLPQHPFDHGNLKGRDEMLMPFPRTPEAVREELRVYYSVIDYLDRQIGRIVQALEASGQLERTVIVFTSDHGMSVGSHGLRGKQNMYEHTINVPLLVAGPGISKRETTAQVYLRDLYPTTCEWAGIPIPPSVTAKSLAPVLRGPSQTHREEI